MAMDMFDDGGDWASYYLDDLREDVKADRKLRLDRLKGRYIIVTKGHKSKKMVFLQDQRVSNKGYWTQFLSNALGFESESDAKKVMSKFKYGNPRVAIVDNSGRYRFIG